MNKKQREIEQEAARVISKHCSTLNRQGNSQAEYLAALRAIQKKAQEAFWNITYYGLQETLLDPDK